MLHIFLLALLLDNQPLIKSFFFLEKITIIAKVFTLTVFHMGPLIGAALVSGGAGLVGQAVNWIAGNHSISAQLDAQKALADHQYNLNMEGWNRQNEYNTPINQMRRLQAAGLNPNLVYGNGSVAGNTTSQVPHYEAPTAGRYQPNLDLQGAIGGALQLYTDMRTKDAQRDLLLQQSLTQAETRALQAAQKMQTLAQTKKIEFDTMRANKLLKYDLDAADLSNRQKTIGIAYTNWQMRQTAKNIEKLDADIQKTKADTALINERKDTQAYMNKFFWSLGINPNSSIGKALFDFITGLIKDSSPDVWENPPGEYYGGDNKQRFYKTQYNAQKKGAWLKSIYDSFANFDASNYNGL